MVQALDEASQIDLGFPYNLYAKEFVRAIAYGGRRDQIVKCDNVAVARLLF